MPRRRRFHRHPAMPWDLREAPHDARIAHPHEDEGEAHAHAGHDHHHLRTLDRRRLVAALGITGAIFFAELIGGFVAHSLALLSDAGHMMTDLSAQLLSLLALMFAVRPADARRTYGYYRLEILAALANGVVLILLALFILYEAYLRLRAPPVVRTNILIFIATIGLLANVASAWMLHGSHSLNVRGAYLHVLSDALSSVAVLLGGLVMALAGWYVIDPILGFFIGIIVIIGAYGLIRDAVSVLLEAVPADIDLEAVREDVRGIEGIEDVHDLHIWTITSGLRALSAHIVVHGATIAASNDDLLRRINALLLSRHGIAHSTLQIESPDYKHVAHLSS